MGITLPNTMRFLFDKMADKMQRKDSEQLAINKMSTIWITSA